MAYAGKTGQNRSYVEVGVSKRTGTVAAGVALGLLVGVGLALLLAPETGADTRRLIRRKVRKLRGRGEDAWDDLRLELRKARRQLRRARLLKEDAASAVEIAAVKTIVD